MGNHYAKYEHPQLKEIIMEFTFQTKPTDGWTSEGTDYIKAA